MTVGAGAPVTLARVTGAITVTLLLATTAPAAAAPSALDQARQASEDTSFDGVLAVRWQDGGSTQVERLTVEGRGATMAVQGGNEVMARSPFERLVAHAGHNWEELWPAGVSPGPRPDVSAKYQVTDVAGGPVVAGRATKTVRISEGATVREQLYLDAATSLVLERDQYGDGGAIVRSMAFESLTLRPAAGPLAEPASAEHVATPVAVRGDTAALAPAALAVGYRRLGVYRSGGVLHALYSDGIYDLSVFEQAGRLRRSDLPGAGAPVRIGAATAWTYPWAGGQIVVWSTKGRTFTAVSDAPADQLLLAVRSLPTPPPEHPSLLAKLKRACKTLMEPLA